nr:winged helix-turn-helix domain-containing protein [Deinococcus ruber]
MLFLAIRDTLPDSGVWTSHKVQQYIQETFNIEVTDVCAWGYLRRLGFSVQMPRPKNAQAATPEEQGIFIKNSWGTPECSGSVSGKRRCPLDSGRGKSWSQAHLEAPVGASRTAANH